MTETIATLKDERDRLLARLEQLDRLLSRYEEWEREAAVVLSGAGAATASPSRATTPPTPTDPTEPREEGTPLREFEMVATKMFEAADAPLQRSDAFAKLREAGVVVVGKEPLNVMTTRFNRMPNITNLRGFGYWLKSRPYPPAGYEPSAAITDPDAAGSSMEQADEPGELL